MVPSERGLPNESRPIFVGLVVAPTSRRRHRAPPFPSMRIMTPSFAADSAVAAVIAVAMLLNGDVIEPVPPEAALLSTKIVFCALPTWNQKLKSPPAIPFKSPSSDCPAQVHQRLIGRDRAEAQAQIISRLGRAAAAAVGHVRVEIRVARAGHDDVILPRRQRLADIRVRAEVIGRCGK